MIFRDEKNAKQLLSTEETASKPVGFGAESFNAAWNATRREEQSISMERAFGSRFDAYRDEVEKLTGERPQYAIDPAVSNLDPFVLLSGGAGRRRQSDYNSFLKDIDRIREKHPNIPEPPDPEGMLEEIISEYDVERREYQDLRSRQTAGGAFADFLGSTVGIMEDPVVMATLPFGASGSAGVLRTALTEAGIAVAVDLPIQLGPVSQTKDVLGVEFTTGDAISNALTAGAVAGGVGGAIAGVSKGLKSLSRGDGETETSSAEPEVRRRRPASATRTEDQEVSVEAETPAAEAEPEVAATETPAAKIASDKQVLEEYKTRVEAGEVKPTPATKRAVAQLERDIDIAESNPAERSAESDIAHEENFNKAYEALQRGTVMSVPIQQPARDIAASSGDDIIADIMTETDLPKPIQARFHDAVSETRTQVSISAPGVYGNLAEYERLVKRQDELLSTPRTKKNRAKINKEIGQVANQIEELRQPRVVASAARDKTTDEFWRVDRPADEITEEQADQALKADLQRAVEEHGEDFEIPIGEAIDEATGGRVSGTTTLKQMMLELDEADQIADEFALCLLSAAEVAA